MSNQVWEQRERLVLTAMLSLTAIRICSVFVGRRARQIYLVLALALVALSGGVRIRTFLLTRKIYAALEGLKQVRVDTTTEEQLLKMVPYLVINDPTLPMLPGGRQYYRAEVSNFKDWRWLSWLRWLPT